MNPSIFNFNEHGVRVVLDDNQEPWFCLTDVCKVLDISRSSDLLQIQRGYVKNETPKRNGALDPKGVADYHTPTSGGIQKLKFINEPNLYRIIFRSNKPQALSFQNWVFQEVLPTIRKTGSYSPTARLTAHEEFNRICMDEKLSEGRGSFHSYGFHRRKREKRLNAIRIQTCMNNLQLTFEGVDHE